IFQINS
nr:Chain A, Lysozyme C [Homo sapiens]